MTTFRPARVVRFGSAAPHGERASCSVTAAIVTPDAGLHASAHLHVKMTGAGKARADLTIRAQDVRLLADTLTAAANEMDPPKHTTPTRPQTILKRA